MSPPGPARNCCPTLGAAFIGFGILTMGLAGQITALGLGHNEDPGPKVFPVALALIMVAGGVVEMARWFRNRKHTACSVDTEAARDVPCPPLGENSRFHRPGSRFVLVVLILFSYAAILGWAGFVLSTLALGTVMMIVLGARLGWAVINAVVMVVLVKGLFGWALKVPLPKGEWGLPF